MAALWRMRGAKQRWGEEVPAAFRHLSAATGPTALRDARGLGPGRRERRNGHGQKTTRDRADDERDATRACARSSPALVLFVDDVADPEFGAWETDASDLDLVDTWRRAGPKPTPVPAFEPRRKKGA